MAKTRKQPVVISRGEALRRLSAMVERIEEDVKIALWAEATLEAGNDIVNTSPARRTRGAAAYNAISQSLALNLAITLARLFDSGSKRWHANRRDVASLPLIVRLLKQRRCQRALVERARSWTPQAMDLADTHARGCQRSIDGAVAAFVGLQRTATGRATAKRLREFRNKRLAHSMMQDTLKALPRYNDLFKLMDVARDVVDAAKLAIDGLHLGLKDTEEACRREADAFWTLVLGDAVA